MQDLAQPPRDFFVYNSILKFREGTVLTNGNIVTLAQLGYEAASRAFDRNRDADYTGKKYPQLAKSKAFTVLVDGNYAYLSSTIKAGSPLDQSLLYSQPPDPKANWGVREELIRCQIQLGLLDERHRTLANCAEPMAINLYQNFIHSNALPNLAGAKV